MKSLQELTKDQIDQMEWIREFDQKWLNDELFDEDQNPYTEEDYIEERKIYTDHLQEIVDLQSIAIKEMQRRLTFFTPDSMKFMD